MRMTDDGPGPCADGVGGASAPGDDEAPRRAGARRFRLHAAEPVDDGVRRIVTEQLGHAARRLGDHAPGDVGVAVHDARKALKRARAVVRVAREQLGDAVYERENATYGDAGRALSGTRDAHVMLQTLDRLTARHASELPGAAFAGLRSLLAAEEAAANEHLAGDADGVHELVGTLESAGARVTGWPLRAEGDARALASGVEWIYRRGRKAQRKAAAEPSTEHLHDLRKRAKDLWYAAELVRPAAPKLLRKLATRAEAVADVIGADHDLAVLAEGARERSASLAPGELEVLDALGARRRERLQRRALKRAKRLYAAPPGRLAKRLR